MAAVRFARENGRPFLGTCGGFQHALIEYARSVCDYQSADHAESNPNGSELIITPLTCSLVEEIGKITFMPGSKYEKLLKKYPNPPIVRLGSMSALNEHYKFWGI